MNVTLILLIEYLLNCLEEVCRTPELRVKVSQQVSARCINLHSIIGSPFTREA